MASHIRVLIPVTCDSVTRYGKGRDFVDVIKASDLKIEEFPGLSSWSQSNQMHPKKQRTFSK